LKLSQLQQSILDYFAKIAGHGGMHSLSYLLEKRIEYHEAPDLFCLDLYQKSDIDQLTKLAPPSTISQIDDWG